MSAGGGLDKVYIGVRICISTSNTNMATENLKSQYS